MRAEQLMDAIGLLPGDLIAAADKCRIPKKKPVQVWKRWAALAASLVLVLGMGMLLLPNMIGMDGSSAPAMDKATQAEAPAAAAPKEEALSEECAEDTGIYRDEAAMETVHPMTLTVQWGGESITVKSANYTVTVQNPDGTAETSIACGPHPLDANLEPHLVAGDHVELLWDEIPDEVTVRCWQDAHSSVNWEDPGETVLSGSVLTLSADTQIYEITAHWGDICTASYAFRLDPAE